MDIEGEFEYKFPLDLEIHFLINGSDICRSLWWALHTVAHEGMSFWHLNREWSEEAVGPVKAFLATKAVTEREEHR